MKYSLYTIMRVLKGHGLAEGHGMAMSYWTKEDLHIMEEQFMIFFKDAILKRPRQELRNESLLDGLEKSLLYRSRKFVK